MYALDGLADLVESAFDAVAYLDDLAEVQLRNQYLKQMCAACKYVLVGLPHHDHRDDRLLLALPGLLNWRRRNSAAIRIRGVVNLSEHSVANRTGGIQESGCLFSHGCSH